jgi:hypothetical protein
VFTIDTPARSAIELVELASGRRRTLRAARRGVAFFNPSLLGGRMLFERVTRCVQQLRLGAVASPAGVSSHAAVAGSVGAGASTRGSRRERVLLSLSSTVARDPGYQPGYTHAYNSASGCPNRRAGRGAATQLATTTLATTRAYVTRLGPAAGNAEIVSVAR